jgi:hypothetical protein
MASSSKCREAFDMNGVTKDGAVAPHGSAMCFEFEVAQITSRDDRRQAVGGARGSVASRTARRAA